MDPNTDGYKNDNIKMIESPFIVKTNIIIILHPYAFISRMFILETIMKLHLPLLKMFFCDFQGTIVYEQTLPGSAYFDVNPSTGDITLVSSLRFDSRIQIVVSIISYGLQ